jgi:hypothetical protein
VQSSVRHSYCLQQLETFPSQKSRQIHKGNRQDETSRRHRPGLPCAGIPAPPPPALRHAPAQHCATRRHTGATQASNSLDAERNLGLLKEAGHGPGSRNLATAILRFLIAIMRVPPCTKRRHRPRTGSAVLPVPDTTTRATAARTMATVSMAARAGRLGVALAGATASNRSIRLDVVYFQNAHETILFVGSGRSRPSVTSLTSLPLTMPSADQITRLTRCGGELTAPRHSSSREEVLRTADLEAGSGRALLVDEGDEETICRFCLGAEHAREMIAPCLCAGSAKFVHRACLDEWRAKEAYPLAFTVNAPACVRRGMV